MPGLPKVSQRSFYIFLYSSISWLEIIIIVLFFVVIVGSTEEQIKQELQAVAEGVAASVFQSSSPSNPDILDNNESAYESNQDEGQISTSSMQHNVEVVYLGIHLCLRMCISISLRFLSHAHMLIYISCFLQLHFFNFCFLFQDVKTKYPDKANLGFPISDGIGRLQVKNLVFYVS